MFKKYIKMFREDMRYVMSRRCGLDELNNFIMLIGFIYIVAALITKKWVFSLVGAIFVILCYMRVFSTNLVRRRKENDFYMQYMGHVVEAVRELKLRIKMIVKSARDKEYKYFVCGACKQIIRVPKGKNKVSIKCPKCGTSFVGRT